MPRAPGRPRRQIAPLGRRLAFAGLAGLGTVALPQALHVIGAAHASGTPLTTTNAAGSITTGDEKPGDAGSAYLLGAVAPPPPPKGPDCVCPEPPRTQPESDLSALAWIFAGVSTAGMFAMTAWGLQQGKRAKLIGEELSRIRINRTSSIRTGRSLGEVVVPPPGLGARPTPGVPPVDLSSPDDPPPHVPRPGPKVPLSAKAAASVASESPEADALREESEARLLAAQATLPALVDGARAVEAWFNSREFETLRIAAGEERPFFERLRRGVAQSVVSFSGLRDARIHPASFEDLDRAVEAYWEEVYVALDQAHTLAGSLVEEAGQRALATVPAGGADALRAQLDALLASAHAYLESDGRRPVPIAPLRTDFDRRLHVAVEQREVPGVPAGKVVSVRRVGIVHAGKLVRKPLVVQST